MALNMGNGESILVIVDADTIQPQKYKVKRIQCQLIAHRQNWIELDWILNWALTKKNRQLSSTLQSSSPAQATEEERRESERRWLESQIDFDIFREKSERVSNGAAP